MTGVHSVSQLTFSPSISYSLSLSFTISSLFLFYSLNISIDLSLRKNEWGTPGNLSCVPHAMIVKTFAHYCTTRWLLISLCAPKMGLYEKDRKFSGRQPLNRGSQPFLTYFYFNSNLNFSIF